MNLNRKLAAADGPDSADELKNYDDRFLKNIGYSVGAHVALVLFFSLKIFFFPDDSLMLQSAVRVDLVALPDKIQDTLAPPKPKAEPPATVKKQPEVKIPKEEKTVVLNPKKVDNKKKQDEALRRLKQMQALEDIEKDVKNERPIKTFKGNQVQDGSELEGLSKLQHDSYVSDVVTHIRRHWVIPQWLANKNFRTKVRVKFDENGAVVAREIVQSSGNASFDEAAMTTLENASPVPKPPDKLKRRLAYQGILVGFPE